MVSDKVRITDPVGLHFRPANKLAEEALKYDCRIELVKGNITANAKSLLSLLAAGVKSGEEVTIRCDGKNENIALNSIVEYVRQNM